MAAEIAKQIEDCSTFFASQQSVLGVAVAETRKSMCTSLSKSITQLQVLDVSGAAHLTEVISSSGFDDASKTQLADAVARRVASSSGAQQQQHRRSTQTLQNVSNYMTPSDWELLNAGGPAVAKITVVVDRLGKLGMRNPSEVTIKHCTALVVSTHCTTEQSASELHDMMLQVKAAFATRKGAPTTLPHITMYPSDPSNLPEEVRAAAYATEGPEPRLVEGYYSTVARVPMRASNKGLHSASAMPSTNPMMMMQQMLSQFQGQQHAVSTTSQPLIHLLNRGASVAPPAAPTPLALCDGVNPTQQSQQHQPLSFAPTPNTTHQQLSQMPQTYQQLSPRPHAQQLSPMPHTAQHQQMAQQMVQSPGAAQALRSNEGAAAADDEIKRLEALAAAAADAPPMAAAKGKAKGKGKAKSKAETKKAPKAKAKAKAAATSAAPNAKAKLKLGCGKCRGSKLGCVQCRDPGYGGRRWQRP